MPKCVTCGGFFPPNLSILKNKDLNDHVCIFCERGLNEVTINIKGYNEVYTKEQCERDYKQMLRELKDRPNIAKVLAKNIKE
jgi:wyosine [tRNA(Phe)-imidazoG37] synthetase (radical SAM superfamily)